MRELLAGPAIVRVYGVHDGLSALVAEKCGCDALWASGLGIAAANGSPDASLLTMTEVRDAATVITRSSRLPVICDCDTGFGDARNVRRMVVEFERIGVAGICLEDKLYPKRNSFLPDQVLIDPWEFAAKIEIAKESLRGSELMIFARLESFIAGAGLEDALERGKLYADAGADALVVHSKASTAVEVMTFAAKWRQTERVTPIVVVPTTYPGASIAELEAGGVGMVIYANHALRASVRAMTHALSEIGRHGTSAPIESELAPVTAIFDLTGEANVAREDGRFRDAMRERREIWDHAAMSR